MSSPRPGVRATKSQNVDVFGVLCGYVGSVLIERALLGAGFMNSGNGAFLIFGTALVWLAAWIAWAFR